MFLQTFFVMSIRVSPIQHTFASTKLVIIEHVTKIVLSPFWIFKQQSSQATCGFHYSIPQQQWATASSTFMQHPNVQLHVVSLINSKLRNNNQNASSIYLYRTSSKADLIWKVKDGSCPNCFYWHQEFLPFSDANKLMGIVLLKE